MALITAYLRFQSIVFFVIAGLFAYSSYKDSQYLPLFGFDVKSFDAIHSTAFGVLLIRSFAALNLGAATIAGYSATFTEHANKKKVTRGIFFFNTFLAYYFLHQLYVLTNEGKKLDVIPTLDPIFLVKVIGSTVLALESFLFSFVTCGGKAKVAKKKTN